MNIVPCIFHKERLKFMKKKVVGTFLFVLLIMVMSVSSFADDIIQENYGSLVFSEDFSTMSTVANGSALSQKTAAEYGSKNVTVYNFGSGGLFGIATPMNDGNKMLEIKPGVTFPQAGLVNLNTTSGITMDGIYTIVVDLYVPSSTTIGRMWDNWTNANVSYYKGGLQTAVFTKISASGLSNFIIYSSSVTGSWYIDKISIYYAPSEAIDVTIYADEACENVFSVKESLEADDTVTLPSKIEFSKVVPDGYELLYFMSDSFAICDPGSVYTVSVADIIRGHISFTPYLGEKADMFKKDIYSDDFENYNEGKITAFTGAVKDLPEGFTGTNKFTLYGIGSATEFSVEKRNDSKVFKASLAANPCFAFAEINLDVPGKYTFSFDYDLPGNGARLAFQLVGNNVEYTKWLNSTEDMSSISDVFVLGKSKSITMIRFYAFDTSSFYVDNFKINYEEIEPVNVYIYTTESEEELFDAAMYYAGDKVVLPSVTDYYGYAPENKELGGFKYGDKTYDPESTYTLTEEDVLNKEVSFVPFFVDSDGMEIVEILGDNFESYSEGTALTYRLSGVKKDLPASFTKANNFIVYAIGTASTYSVETAYGNKMLKASLASKNPCVAFAEINLDVPGIYTFVYEYVLPTAGSSMAFQLSGTDVNHISRWNATGSAKTVTETYKIEENSGKNITQIRFYSYDTTEFYIGKVSVYFEELIDESLYAPATELKPGLNLLNGRAEPYTFEGAMTDIPFVLTSGSLVNNPTRDTVNTSRKVLKFPLNGANLVSYNLPEKSENDRPVFISFDRLKNYESVNGEAGNIASAMYICKNDSQHIAQYLAYPIGTAWVRYSGFPVFDGAYKAGAPSIKDYSDLSTIVFVNSGEVSAGTTWGYYDNVVIMPSYKITYYVNDGTDAEHTYKYFLMSGGNTLANVMTTYSPDLSVTPEERFGYKFLGWSLNKDSDIADAPESISLNNEDIALYAVWEKDTSVPDAVTAVYDFETPDSYILSADDNSLEYKDGMAVVSTDGETVLDVEELYLNSDALYYAVIRAKLSGDTEFKFNFTTDAYPDYSDDKSYAIDAEASDKFETYIISLSGNEYLTGKLTECTLEITGEAGEILIEDITLCSQLPKTEEIDVKSAIYASSYSITEDMQDITLYPYYRKADGKVERSAHYATNGTNAVLTRNDDGTAVLSGRVNGEIVVTAYFGDGTTTDLKILISGQQNRKAAPSYKVMMVGNSFRKHGPNSSLGWYGNWGMAASAEDKDYAHRFMARMDEKFGKGAAVLIDGPGISGLEGTWGKNQSNPNYDYSADFAFLVKGVKEAQPDILTIQCGENAGVSVVESYKNALTQLVSAIQEECPDTIIVICTPFNGNSAMTEGAILAGETLGIPVAKLHPFTGSIYRAYGNFSVTAVASHPGDIGMDTIAGEFFKEVNILLTENDTTVYAEPPKSVTISADSYEITEDLGTLQLNATISPEDALEGVIWSVDNENIATVSDDGVVSAVSNGIAVVTATSRYNENAFDTVEITVSGQSAAAVITFNKNSSDDVSDMPEPVTVRGAQLDLTGLYPERAYYNFKGWSKTAYGEILDNTLDVDGDTTLYAIWEAATKWYFDRDDYSEGFVALNGFNFYIAEGCLRAIATETNAEEGNILTFKSPELLVDSDVYKKLAIRMQNSTFGDDTYVTLNISATSGDYEFTKPVVSSEMTDYLFDISEVSGTITGFEILPTDIDCTVRIDSIEFISADNTVNYLKVSDDGVTLYAETDVPENAVAPYAMIAYFSEDGRLLRSEIRLLIAGEKNVISANFVSEDLISYAKIMIMQKSLSPVCDVIVVDAPTDSVGAYTLLEAQTMAGAIEREPSGWVLSNRGGIPTDAYLSSDSFKLSDISDSDNTVLTRKFNEVRDSVLELKTSVTVEGTVKEGMCLAFENYYGKDVYRVAMDADNNWTYLNSDGSSTVIYKTNLGESVFKFVVVVDMIKNNATTYINDKNCGTFTLALPDTSIYAFRFGTLPQTLGTIEVKTINIEANYAINDSFSWDTADTIPHGWEGDGAKKGRMSSSDVLCIDGEGRISKVFDALKGTIITEFEFLAGDGVNVTLAEKSGKAILNFVSQNGKLYVNDKEVYTYALNVWYRMRFEADTETGKIIVKLNGRKIDEVAFKKDCGCAEKLTLANNGKETIYIDTVKVYKKIIYDDYVPVPVIPEGYGEYLVGVNACSLWRNDGTHYGWAPITPHERPVLGYYDEGSPEAADWEIKYLVEHGVVYQSVCWFVGESNAPLKSYPNVKHFHDGFMNAEYSHMMKYFINFEVNTNMVRPAGSEAWRKYFVPAIIENYFKDDRYLVIDNKPVFSVYSAGMLIEEDCFGSIANAALEFEYLEEEAKKLGFSGVLFIASSIANEGLGRMGFDTALPYGYGNGVNTFETNKSINLASRANASNMFSSPTISVGYSSNAWWGFDSEKKQLMSVEDFRLSHEWVVNEYLPNNATEGTYQELLIGNGTWNEYGEGNFIMPGLYNSGFGYLDVLREVYTKEEADPSLNVVPTESQLERINRMYPSDFMLIKGLGYYTALYDDSLYSSVYKINKDSLDSVKITDGKRNYWTNYKVSVNTERVNTLVDITLSEELDLSLIDTIKIQANGGVGNHGNVYARIKGTEDYISIGSPTYLDGMRVYYFDVSSKEDIIDRIRIKPTNNSSVNETYKFELDYIEFLSIDDKDIFTINIDGKSYKMSYPFIKTENEEYLIPFETKLLPDRLGVSWNWDNASKVLTLKSKDHEVIFKVTGSDACAKSGLINEKATKEYSKLSDGTMYLVDGVKKELGYECYTFDGMPVLPIKKLCDALGYKYDDSTGVVTVETCHKFYYDIVNSQAPGEWEFNLSGITEGWKSVFMALETKDGYLHCVSITNSTDPTIRLEKSLDLSQYTKIEMRIKVDVEKESVTSVSPYFYFITDKDRTWGEDKKIRTTETVKNHGDWAVLTYDLTAVETWKDNLVSLRLDPFDAIGSCDIDYIRLVK